MKKQVCISLHFTMQTTFCAIICACPQAFAATLPACQLACLPIYLEFVHACPENALQ
jgi:hypothetical protein